MLTNASIVRTICKLFSIQFIISVFLVLLPAFFLSDLSAQETKESQEADISSSVQIFRKIERKIEDIDRNVSNIKENMPSEEVSRNDRFEKLEDRLTEKETKVQNALDDLHDISLQLSAEKLFIGNYIFEIFISSLFVVGVLATISGVGIYSLVSKRAMTNLSAKVKEYSEIAAKEAQVKAYREFSFTWFALYEPIFLKSLEKPDEFWDSNGSPKELLLELRERIHTAISMAERGMEKIPKYNDLQFHKSEEEWLLQVSFQNHLVYHRTAEYRVQFHLKADVPKLENSVELKDDCRRLISCSEDSRSILNGRQSFWYQTRHTGAFCLALLGKVTDDQVALDEGMKYLENLVTQNPPTKKAPLPTKEWCAEIWDECKRTGLKLNVPRPSI